MMTFALVALGFFLVFRRNGIAPPGTAGSTDTSMPEPNNQTPPANTVTLTREQCQTWDGTFNDPPTAGQSYCATTFPELYPNGFRTRAPVVFDAPEPFVPYTLLAGQDVRGSRYEGGFPPRA